MNLVNLKDASDKVNFAQAVKKGLGKNQLSPAAEALRKEVNESIENTKAAEKMKADTIPEPVQSPSKEEPNK